MILANISVPLLGLVDTAVIGHLASAHSLAAIALGSSTVTLLIWLLGFLRMSTTGLIAQSLGKQEGGMLLTQLYSGLLLAILLALTLNLASPFIIAWMGTLSNASDAVYAISARYIEIRLYGAPAALVNLVLLGALLGMQNGKGPFYVVLFTNLLNIILDLWFVVVLEFGVEGAAWASVVSEYSACVLASYLTLNVLKRNQVDLQAVWPTLPQLLSLLSLNRDIFIRSLVLQACFSFMTFYGARLGDVTLAANAVLLNFLLLLSFAMDGIAYALEAKVGQAQGKRAFQLVDLWVKVGFFWGAWLAVGYAMVFWLGGTLLINLLTTIEPVRIMANEYIGWIILLPLVATSSFLLDGVFVGLTRATEMRNSMVLSGVVGFVIPFMLSQHLGNHALWLAMSCFMLLRGLTLAYRYQIIRRQTVYD